MSRCCQSRRCSKWSSAWSSQWRCCSCGLSPRNLSRRNNMTVTVKVLIPAKTAENSQTTQYTATNVTTIIDKFTATNFSATAATLSVNLVTAADTAGNQNLITKTKTLAASEVYTFPEIVGQVLMASGFISTIAGTATAINIRASGREVS